MAEAKPAWVRQAIVLTSALLVVVGLASTLLLAGRLRPYWLARYHGEEAVLRSAALAGLNLRGVNLRWADLSGADLRGTVLARADLWAARFVNADLTRADLRGADLQHCDVKGADLTGALLTGANLEDARYDFATRWPRGCDPRRHSAVLDLSGGKYGGASFRDKDLSAARLHGADLSGADLTGANLERARYNTDTRWPSGFDPPERGASLDCCGGDYRGVDYRGADLRSADLGEAVFSNADLRGANLSYTNLAHTSFGGAGLEGVNLTGAVYDEQTAWPDGFQPEAHGARYSADKGYWAVEAERLRLWRGRKRQGTKLTVSGVPQARP